MSEKAKVWRGINTSDGFVNLRDLYHGTVANRVRPGHAKTILCAVNSFEAMKAVCEMAANPPIFYNQEQVDVFTVKLRAAASLALAGVKGEK